MRPHHRLAGWDQATPIDVPLAVRRVFACRNRPPRRHGGPYRVDGAEERGRREPLAFSGAPPGTLAAPALSRLPVFREVFAGAGHFPEDDSPAALAAAVLAATDGRADPVRRQAGRSLVGSHTWSRAAAAHVDVYDRVARR